MGMKPKVFIGSSREGVKIADAIHANMTYEAECTVWKNGVFQLSENTLASLIKALRDSDFGVFIFSPDDISLMRGQTVSVVRDNVLFELGLFVGRLGAERCFFLVPDDAPDLRLPSDLAGITPGVFESGRSDENWTAAVNPACMQIKGQISRLKSFQDADEVGTQSNGANLRTPSKSPATRRSTKPKPKTSKSRFGEDLSAATYKNSYLVTGNTKDHRERLKEVGCSWNNKLQGWVLSPSKLDGLKEAFPGITIDD
ncbi:TIR domain-containing protein [Qipengyuania sp.]|uniref:TIR domain-containing protein n=1 Tax=Qipengyuania sp. TaxID=2004515 RepID=UPI0035C7D010